MLTLVLCGQVSKTTISSWKKIPRTLGLWWQPHLSTDLGAILPFYVLRNS